MIVALPASITAIAYRAENGELAWRRDDVPAALAAIAASGQAVLGGEVWVTLGRGDWTGLVPFRNGGPDGVWAWDTKPRSAVETWQKYCDRAARDSERIVAGLRMEDEADPSVAEALHFNFTFISEPGDL